MYNKLSQAASTNHIKERGSPLTRLRYSLEDNNENIK